MHRRTKIIATLGPATDDPAVMRDLINAGVDVVRINFSHGAADQHRKRVQMLREITEQLGREVGVLGDLQGPKIRIDQFVEGSIELDEGDTFVLDASLDPAKGTRERVGIAYKDLVKDVQTGDRLMLDDGRLVLQVGEVTGTEIRTHVVVGGVLSNNKGINRQGGGLSAVSISEKDRADIKLAAEVGVDYLAVSFVRSAADVKLARELARTAGCQAGIVSKIERAEAMDVIDDIIAASDAVMIARGDLGVEIGDAELPAAQKHLINKSRRMNRIVITATQMMESMINNSIPTRAEVFDVANAVLDGTDVVMLSGETAVGHYPVQVVESMSRICIEAEKQRTARQSQHRINEPFEFIDEAIAMATMYAANHLGVRAIAALTESGSTALWMSRISSGIPIYALTRHVQTRRKVTLYRGVYPAAFNTMGASHAHVNKEAVEVLLENGVVQDGDLVIITKGDLKGVGGGTNAMKIARVGGLIDPEEENA